MDLARFTATAGDALELVGATVIVVGALSLQYSPSVIRTFLVDGVTRSSLAVFTASFLYARCAASRSPKP